MMLMTHRMGMLSRDVHMAVVLRSMFVAVVVTSDNLLSSSHRASAARTFSVSSSSASSRGITARGLLDNRSRDGDGATAAWTRVALFSMGVLVLVSIVLDVMGMLLGFVSCFGGLSIALDKYMGHRVVRRQVDVVRIGVRTMVSIMMRINVVRTVTVFIVSVSFHAKWLDLVLVTVIMCFGWAHFLSSLASRDSSHRTGRSTRSRTQSLRRTSWGHDFNRLDALMLMLLFQHMMSMFSSFFLLRILSITGDKHMRHTVFGSLMLVPS
jgi:hypothetical protein